MFDWLQREADAEAGAVDVCQIAAETESSDGVKIQLFRERVRDLEIVPGLKVTVVRDRLGRDRCGGH